MKDYHNSNRSTTNYLFHYTKKLDTFIEILEYGFLPNYCKEIMPDGEILSIPMVSFCDIPLTMKRIISLERLLEDF